MQDDIPVRLSSSPCLADAVRDADQARDVARWRRAEREMLLAARRALTSTQKHGIEEGIMSRLLDFLQAGMGDLQGKVLSGYWPIKAEPDLRPALHLLRERGLRIALPVVEIRAAPLVFREWTARTRMIRGDWGIPVPPPDAPYLQPDIALAPVLGWDAAGFRLGYGGGYFDRTLAVADPRPFVIGIGPESARLATIFPQPHDVALDLIVTEAAVHRPAQATRPSPSGIGAGAGLA